MTSSIYGATLGALILTCVSCAGLSTAQSADESEPKPAIVTDGGEGTPIAFPLHPTSRLASASATESGLSLFEIEIPAGTAGAPPHRHTHEDEFFYVRQGEVTFLTDGTEKTISAGGLALLPRGGWHAMWNSEKTDAILLVGTSDGQFDDVFDAVAIAAATAGELSPPEIGAIVARVGAERGITIDMTKVPDGVRHLYGMPPAE